MMSYALFQNVFMFRKPVVAIFPDILKIVIMFIKTIFKVKKLEIIY